MKYWLCAILGFLVLAVPVFGEGIPLPEWTVMRLGLESERITDVKFSPNGEYLAVATSLGIQLRNADTLKLVRFFQCPRARCVAFSPNGKLLASGSEDKTVNLWEIGTGKLLYTLEGHEGAVNAVAFSPSGKLLASGGEWPYYKPKDFEVVNPWDVQQVPIRLWEVRTGKLLLTLKGGSSSVFPQGHTDDVEALAFSPDGRFLASGSKDQLIKLWNVTSGILVDTFSW